MMITTAQKLAINPDNFLQGYIQIHRVADDAASQPGVIIEGCRNNPYYQFADGSMMSLDHLLGLFDIDWPKRMHKIWTQKNYLYKYIIEAINHDRGNNEPLTNDRDRLKWLLDTITKNYPHSIKKIGVLDTVIDLIPKKPDYFNVTIKRDEIMKLTDIKLTPSGNEFAEAISVALLELFNFNEINW